MRPHNLFKLLVVWVVAPLLLGAVAPSERILARNPAPKVFAFYSQGLDADRSHLRAAAKIVDVIAPQYYTLDLSKQSVNERVPDADLMGWPGRTFEIWPVINAQVASHSALLDDQEVRQRLVDTFAALARKHNYEGLTLDIEGVAPQQGTSFTALVVQLGAVLDLEGRDLAVYVPRRTAEVVTNWAAAYDWRALSVGADLVLAAGYSESFATPGPITTSAGFRQVLDHARASNQARIAPLIGSFGYRWLDQPRPSEVISTVDAGALLSSTGVRAKKSDGETSFTYNGGTVWFENLTGLTARVQAVRDRRFPWVALFSLGREPLSLWKSSALR